MITFKVDNLKNMNAELKAFADFLRSRDIADEQVFLSRLVSCELITNVIRHGGEAALFRGTVLVDKIEISVRAQSLDGVNLNPSLPDVLAENGRGMYIIKSVGEVERGAAGELRVYIKI